MREERPDVCIIGVGATGGIAAYALAEAGLKVVGLEAGPFWRRADFRMDELESAYERNIMGPKYMAETPTWRPNSNTPAVRARFETPMMNGVGGASVNYAAHSWRNHPYDFTIFSSTVARYGPEAIPEGAALADWPVTYQELEPCYDKVEYALGVKGGQSPGPDSTGGQSFRGAEGPGVPAAAPAHWRH